MSLQQKFPACHVTVIRQTISVNTLISPTVRSENINRTYESIRRSICLSTRVVRFVWLANDQEHLVIYTEQLTNMSTSVVKWREV
jgi:hypothetical protein